MEKGWEYSTLISELTNGLELTKQLKVHLNSVETRELLLERVLLSLERALTVLNWNGSSLLSSSSEGQLQLVSLATGVPDSSNSGNGSPRSEDMERGHKYHLDHRDVSKKRKVMSTWTDQVKVCSENPIDDGYSWRKYGQKDILGAKYPRSYYRCTYRNIQNCWATKQVQRSDKDPTILDITYKGKHICNSQASKGVPPEKQQAEKQINNHNTQYQQPDEFLSNLRENLRVNTDQDWDNNKEMTCPFTFPSTSFEFGKNGNQKSFPFSTLIGGEDALGGFFSPSFISPATSESNYFSVSPSQMVHNLQHSESEFNEIISAHTSATNFPLVDLDFSVTPVSLEANFPFHTLGFFN